MKFESDVVLSPVLNEVRNCVAIYVCQLLCDVVHLRNVVHVNKY
jgi:hypothetical protein